MKCFLKSIDSRACGVALATLAVMMLLSMTNEACAAPASSANSIYTNTTASGIAEGQTMIDGWNMALYWIFMIFKGAAVVMTGWGAFELYKGDMKAMAFSFLAAIVLFFSPTIVDLAFGIGKAASGGTTAAAGR